LKKILFLFLLLSFTLLAQKFDFSGYGSAGIKFFDRNRLNGANQETYYEGKFQVEINLKKGFEAQLDFRGNNIDKSVELREFSVKYKSDSWYNIKFGNIKQPFGYEYLINREKLWAIDRSIVQEKISEIGYGTRSISLMIYHEFDDKKPGAPYSYYLSLFKNNSSTSGFVGRISYHFNQELALSFNYMFQALGGDVPAKVSGFASDIAYRSKKFDANIEIIYAGDPVEKRIRKLAGKENSVYAFGVKTLLARKFKTGDDFLEDIEPVIVAGYFQPENDQSQNHIIQGVIGSNFYFDDDIRMRLNADMRFSKTEYTDDYSTKESRLVLEMQVKF